MQLLANPLKVGVLQRFQLPQRRRQQLVVLLQRLDDFARGQVQLGQAAPVVLHLLNKFRRSCVPRQDSGGGSGRQSEQSGPGFDSEAKLG